MSMDMSTSELVCYVHCNFCNTILAVSVPCSNMYNLVTVRCGHCGTLLSVNLAPSFPSLSPPNFQFMRQLHNSSEDVSSSGSSSLTPTELDDQQLRSSHIRPPATRQRVPSAYNRFIKEEIRRIKASNPDISHRQAFSTAAKNWAHLPRIHLGSL